jgi:flagellar hook protein FlgE
VSTDPLNIGLSGLEAYSTAIDVSANNVANVGTAGFQAQDTEFGELYSGAVAARISTNASPGGLDPTGNATNVAITGAGFFVLAGANGILVDAATGFTVTGVNGGSIAIPAGVTALSIGTDGTVSATLANGQAGSFGRVVLAVFQNPGGLLRVGGGYQASANSGNVLLGAPASAGYGSLVPGFLESSNVDLAAEMIKMIASQAAYKANAKSVTTGDEILKTAINIDNEGHTA